MARSVFLHPEHKETARLALDRNGFLTQGDLSSNLGIALSTVNNFFNCKPISISKFEQICEALNLDKRAILQPIAANKSASVTFSAYNPQTFTGRDAEIALFTTLLSGSCRILAITGMTGIGKTALAERVVANLMEIPNAPTLPYIRFSLDDRSLSPDFSISGAALLRTLGEEPTLADQQDVANLLAHILKRLCSNPCRLQIDSLEWLLKGNEQEGWSEFCDPLWLDLLHQFVAGNDCPSQLLLTSQDITGDLDAVASRYSEFYQCQTLRGLKPDDQQDFFQKLGLSADTDSTVTDVDYLNRIGAFYDGHPLVLQVIADEILQPPFQGNIARYWHHYGAEFSETADPTTNKLARSRLFRCRVRQRVEQTIQRLPSNARQMLCACAVFRRPVPIGFWLAMLKDEEPQAEFDTLQDRHLVEFVSASDNTLLVRQHNLIRSVAYDLLKANASIWEQAERQAACLWFTVYKPKPNTPNIETVRGHLEAFEHYYKVGDWEAANNIVWTRLNTPTQDYLCWQIKKWGYFKETLYLHLKQLDIAYKMNNTQEIEWALGNLGNAYQNLGQYNQAIDLHRQALIISREIGDRWSEGIALGGLGNAYSSLGKYEQAIDFYQQYLEISRKIGDHREEGIALINLGKVHHSFGQYRQAIDCHQKALTISREVGDRQNEGSVLGGLGGVCQSLGQHTQAIDFYQQALIISREVGDRQSEGSVLGGLGCIYEILGQYEQAIDFHQQYLTIANEISDRKGEGHAQCGLGNAYGNSGKHEQAIACYQQYLMIAREISDRQSEGVALGNLGVVQLRLKQYPASLTHIQSALDVFREIGMKAAEAETLRNLTELYQALGKVEIARQYCQQALALATELDIPLAAECQTLMESLDREAEEEKVVQEKIS
jgi:tetratricopeptide (TPR) repeat protein/DNA-binding Xre family transcriptional regulator